MFNGKELPSQIPRPDYLERIRPFIGKGLIKGPDWGSEESGKATSCTSSWMRLANEIRRSRSSISISSSTSSGTSGDGDALYRYVASKLKADAPNALFIDEIREVRDFELALRSLLAEGRCDIYCTGSNADLLSGELATHLAGTPCRVPDPSPELCRVPALPPA